MDGKPQRLGRVVLRLMSFKSFEVDVYL